MGIFTIYNFNKRMLVKPFNIKIMDVNEFIKKHNIARVTSPFIKESTTGNFDQQGLFSEQIFGEIGTPNRLIKFGHIELNTTLFHPEIFDVIMSMKGLYQEIVSGKAYAIFDEKECDFKKTSNDDPDAETGFQFFIENCTKLKFEETEAPSRNNKVKLVKDSIDRWLITKHLVEPAGIRDYKEKNGRGEYDDVNKIYKRLIEVATTIQGSKSSSKIFDNVRYMLQKSVNEIYAYIWTLYSEEYMPNKYASRSVARATRNVIAATDIAASDANPDAHLKPDEVFVPLYQAMHALMPLFKNKLKLIFLNNVFSIDSNQASLIDHENYNLKYVEISMEEKAKYTTSDKMDQLINAFRDEDLRHYPFTVKGVDGKHYFLWLKYEVGEHIYMARSFTEMKRILEEKKVVTNLELKDVQPMTYYEIYYITAYMASIGKHVTVTRYPVTHHLSIFPAKIHVTTTVNFSKKYIHTLSDDPANNMKLLPRFPEHGSSSVGGVSLHPAQLKNLGADKQQLSIKLVIT